MVSEAFCPTFAEVLKRGCLNPCSYGRWSQRLKTTTESRLFRYCLNPCCCGRWSQRHFGARLHWNFLSVLILVLVEDGLGASPITVRTRSCLNPCSCGRWLQRQWRSGGFGTWLTESSSLFLWKMVSECMNLFTNNQIFKRLNPCCYGRWSQRIKVYDKMETKFGVLILVVMEDGLRVAWRRGVSDPEWVS